MVPIREAGNVAAGRPQPLPTASDEANHRIANSLQLVAAMISLEARSIADPAGRAALEITRHRVSAIAAVHRMLFRTQTERTVDLAAYLQQLGEEFQKAGADASAGRRILVDTAPTTVSAEDAMAVGMIVSEVVTNALRHAYLPEQAGDIRIALQPAERGRYTLLVEDYGRGFSKEAGNPGLGTRLIDTLAARLGAECRYEAGSPGTRFLFAASSW